MEDTLFWEHDETNNKFFMLQIVRTCEQLESTNDVDQLAKFIFTIPQAHAAEVGKFFK